MPLFYGPRTRSWRITAVGASFAGVCLFLIFLSATIPNLNRNAASTVKWPQHYTVYGHDVYVELPPTFLKAPRGVLVFFHGCNHAGSDLWPPTPQCPQCLGLPEEMRIRQAVLKHKLGMLAISSLHATAHGKGCWTLERGDRPGRDDLVSVHAILNVIFKKMTLNPAATRIYLLGVSSGGAFAMILPQLMQVDGSIIQIMGLPSSILAATLAEASASPSTSYPPTVFMHMPKDGHVGSLVESNINDFHMSGFKATQIRRNSVSVTPDYLRSRAPSVFNDELANDIVDKLDEDGFLDENGFLKADPRLTYKAWTRSVGPLVNESISLVSDSSPLTELLNLAWAGHEIMSDGVVEALKWLQAPKDVDELKVLEHDNDKSSTP